MTTTPQDSETPETDACEKAIDDFWNDPNRSPGLVESMEEAKKSGIISPLAKCRQLERRAIAAEESYRLQYQSDIELRNILTSEQERYNQLRTRNEQVERDNEMAFYQLFHADVSSESEIKAHNYKVKDLVCILIAQRDSLRSERDALKKQVEELIYAGQELARVASLAKCKWYHGEKDVIYDSHDLAKLIAKSVNYFNNLKP